MDYLARKIKIVNASTELNFEININNVPIMENKILLDFMECFQVADIFLIKEDI
jgi:hypothetical protein